MNSVNDFYATLKMPGRFWTSSSEYRYGFQGEYAEIDSETGFNHFTLRDYDSRIGRWTKFDPYNQFFSPYIGMGNNSRPGGGHPSSNYNQSNYSSNSNGNYPYSGPQHTTVTSPKDYDSRNGYYSSVSYGPAGGGDGFNIWGDISNSFLVGAAANQPTYFRSSQIAKEGKFAADGWKTYSNAFKGNQYVSSASVKEAKAAFNSVVKTTIRISTGLTLLSFGVNFANHEAGNVSDGRYYVQQTINAIGLFGPTGAGIAILLGAVDAI